MLGLPKIDRMISRVNCYISLAQLNSILVLGGILSLGIWGHIYHWDFGSHDTHGEHHAVDSHAASSAQGTVSHASKVEADFVVAETRSQERLIEAHGMLVHNPDYVAGLSTRTSGTVWRVMKKVGDYVRAGDVLALVESTPVGEAKAELLKGIVQSDLKSQTLARLQAHSDVVSEKKIQEAIAEADEARIRLFDAQQSLSNLGLVVNLDQFSGKQDQELAAMVLSLGVPDSIMSEHGCDRLTANLVPVTAPFDGELIEVGVVVGEQIRASQPEFVVADRRHYWINLNIHREDAARISLGQQVRFRADTSTEEFLSRITWIATEVDEATRTMQARAELVLDEHAQLTRENIRGNVLGTGTIETQVGQRVTVVPSRCILWNGKNFEIVVQTPNHQTERRCVALGGTDAELVEVLSGVVAGELISLDPEKFTGSPLSSSSILRIVQM